MTALLHTEKANLRQQVCEKLKVITAQERDAASFQICDRLRQQEIWMSANAVLLFAPMASEPDVWPLLEEALTVGKTVALPRFSPTAKFYHAARIQNLEQDLRRGQLGIREPTDVCAELPLDRLELVLVPGVAFDLQGHRLGWGKGYYDRLLAEVRGVKCGVAFDEQIVEGVPVGPLDVHLDGIVTPTRVIGRLEDR